jgi:hypothetical protein
MILQETSVVNVGPTFRLGATHFLQPTLRALVAFWLICFGVEASAYTSLDAARRAYQAVPFSTFYASREQRVVMAEALRDYWADFDNRLPRLSPKELEWIAGEMDTTDTVRLGRLMQMKEFDLWTLGNLADQCTAATENLLAALNTEGLNETEMFHWTKVANCYHQSDGSIFRHLQGAGLDDKGDAEDGHTLDPLLLSRILNVIIPSSMADTMGWTLSQD